jgi:hypothetical protein
MCVVGPKDSVLERVFAHETDQPVANGTLTLFLPNGDTTKMSVFGFSCVHDGIAQYRLAAEGPFYYTNLRCRFEHTKWV